MKHQTGSSHVVLIVGLIVALIGALGFIFWQNFIHQESPRKEVEVIRSTSESGGEKGAAQQYTLNDAVTGINAVLKTAACSGSGAVTDEGAYRTVQTTDPYVYEGGKSTIDATYTYAYVQYGCGSSGSSAFMKRESGEWKLIEETAVVYPTCENIRGQGFPSSVVEQCVPRGAVNPVAI